MAELSAAEIRRRLLEERRQFLVKGPEAVTYRQPGGDEQSTLMRHVQARFKEPLTSLLWEDSLTKVAEKLDVSRATVLRWRKLYPEK